MKEIIERVRRLLALRHAQRLMARHRLKAAVVSAECPEEREAVEKHTEVAPTGSSVAPTWQWAIFSAVCAVNRCEGYCSKTAGLQPDGRVKIHGFWSAIGRASDAAAVGYVFQYLRRQVEVEYARDAAERLRAYGSPNPAWRNTYLLHAAGRVAQRIREQAAEANKAVERDATGSALVLVREDAEAVARDIATVKRSMHLRTQGAARFTDAGEGARAAGRAAGDRIDISTGVGRRGALEAGARRLGP